MQDEAAKQGEPALPDHLNPEKVFGETACAVAAVAGIYPKQYEDLLRQMDADGVRFGQQIGEGSVAHNALWEGVDTPGRHLPKGIVRLDYADLRPMHEGCPIVLKPGFQKNYTITYPADEVDPEKQESYQAFILPYVPDEKDHPVQQDDVIRSLRVLKRLVPNEEGVCHIATDAELTPKSDCAEDKIFTAFDHLKDFRSDQFTFIRNPETGDFIRYPEHTDPEYSGKPIAFIRDLNSITTQRDVGSACFGRMSDHGYSTDMPPAPIECVEACNQQYDRTRVLHNDLKAAGITPNVEIPAKSAPRDARIEGATPANEQARSQQCGDQLKS